MEQKDRWNVIRKVNPVNQIKTPKINKFTSLIVRLINWWRLSDCLNPRLAILLTVKPTATNFILLIKANCTVPLHDSPNDVTTAHLILDKSGLLIQNSLINKEINKIHFQIKPITIQRSPIRSSMDVKLEWSSRRSFCCCYSYGKQKRIIRWSQCQRMKLNLGKAMNFFTPCN